MITGDDSSMKERLAKADRAIERARLRERICDLGGIAGRLLGGSEDVSEAELAFLQYALAWESGPRSTHCTWLARNGQNFIPPAELAGPRLKTELWRLIHALAGARVFFYQTNHLNDAELYARLWSDVLPAECPDAARSRDDACHWDFADAGSGAEDIWLRFYASRDECEEWRRDFPETPVPERRRPPYRRDHRLPVRN